MSRQDRQGARTPAALDQKYNLGGRFSKLEEQDAKQSREMTKQSMTVGEFIPYAQAFMLRLEKELGTLRQTVADNKISYEDRFKKLDTSITQINLTIHGINESLVRFEGQFASIQQTLNTQAETLSSFNGSLEDFLGRLETVEQEIKTIKSKVPGL